MTMILRNFARNLYRPNRPNLLKPVDYAVCIDIECTCDSPIQISPMEVIEIACLKLDLKINHDGHDYVTSAGKNQKFDSRKLGELPKFHRFVRPAINPELTLFCQELTGLTQSTVDQAEPFSRAVDNLLVWLQEQDLIDTDNNPKEKFAFASCGNFDLSILSPLVKKCKFRGDLELPIYFKEWINVKKTFVNHKKEWPKGLYHMLEILDEEPSGRLHSAEDDCKNLARIVQCLLIDGCKFHITNRAS